MTDRRIVYGATCTWWDSIDQAVRHPNGSIPACPHCAGPLFEVEMLAEFEALFGASHLVPSELLAWGRGRCFASMDGLRNARAKAELTFGPHEHYPDDMPPGVVDQWLAENCGMRRDRVIQS